MNSEYGKYQETMGCIEQNLKEVCKRGILIVEEVFCFVAFANIKVVCLMLACL